MECPICENRCQIPEGGLGTCGMYLNRGGSLVERFPDQYLVKVPAEIEAMPMLHFHPGGKFLQVCTIGCNFRCSGCVSWLLTESPGSLESALRSSTAEEVVARAIGEDCLGVMFCFNEPAVSFPSFKRLASEARRRGLLVGCATNGYFREEAFRELLAHIDFVNLGIKGCTDETYRQFGVISAGPVFRNLELAAGSGVATEVAAVYIKGREAEVLETARRIAAISPTLPLQLMRFIPLASAEASEEPSIREAEQLCHTLRQLLPFTYLFNSPGTSFLDTVCTSCGGTVIRRGFNGPMGAHTASCSPDGRCACGAPLPIVGRHHPESQVQVLGFAGGYKTIVSLESIQATLAFLGERRPEIISRVLHQLLQGGFMEELYARTKTLDAWFDTLAHYGWLAGRTQEAGELKAWIQERVALITRRIAGAAGARPRVYFSLGHPLIAVFGDKFECNLVELAGGHCVNREIRREDVPGMALSPDLMRELDPEVILTMGGMGYPVEDMLDVCLEQHLRVRAVRAGRVHSLKPFPIAGRPDWILGFMRMAELLHPGLFDFDMEAVAEDFYQRFLGVPFRQVRASRSPGHPSLSPIPAHCH
nr:radical SAM protein [uncultured Holophaga sp.]